MPHCHVHQCSVDVSCFVPNLQFGICCFQGFLRGISLIRLKSHVPFDSMCRSVDSFTLYFFHNRWCRSVGSFIFFFFTRLIPLHPPLFICGVSWSFHFAFLFTPPLIFHFIFPPIFHSFFPPFFISSFFFGFVLLSHGLTFAHSAPIISFHPFGPIPFFFLSFPLFRLPRFVFPGLVFVHCVPPLRAYLRFLSACQRCALKGFPCRGYPKQTTTSGFQGIPLKEFPLSKVCPQGIRFPSRGVRNDEQRAHLPALLP